MIRVMQIVDSSAIGGKEKMVISIANSIAENKEFESYICLTTKEGPLLKEVNSGVKTISLDKRFAIDLIALYKLVRFIKENKINLIHAHSSSFFISVLCKLFVKVKIIWHDHNGKRSEMKLLPKSILKLFSFTFSFVLVVSNKLETWAQENLNISHKKIFYLPNFTNKNNSVKEIDLIGKKERRIVCVANLRDPKNHILLLKSFNKIFEKYIDWHVFLVGKDYNDEYSDELKTYIKNNEIRENVHILGVRTDIPEILHNSSIGVLSSQSEGLPVSLLEYGMSNLAVLTTDVGYCKKVLKNGEVGLISSELDENTYAHELDRLMSNNDLRDTLAKKFHSHVKENYSEEAVMKQLSKIYKDVV